MKRKVSDLRPHPLNNEVYDAFDHSRAADLINSIKENGILEPLVVRDDGTILSGHRRWECAKFLGLEDVETVPPAPGADERTVIIEHNRYRVKTLSERMREAEVLFTVEQERALVRMGEGPSGAIVEDDKGRTNEKVADAIGMKRRTFEKSKEIYEHAKTNENAKATLAKIDAGTLSIDAGHKAIRMLTRDERPGVERPDFIRTYNAWTFSENDPRFGIPHPGRIPGQIAGNTIFYFTEPGDLVVDPMAGGGSTLDVAEFLGRRSIGYDVAPRRPDIIKHNIADGFPDECREAQLIFMDPPYWNMIDEGYTDESSSRMSLDDFAKWYTNLMLNAAMTVRIGGFIAVVNMGQYFRLPESFKGGYIDWPTITYNLLERTGVMAPWARIQSQIAANTYTAFDVTNALEGRFMLPVARDIVIARRVK